MRFEIESSFAERFARLLPSAPVRQLFLERAILSRIERALAVARGEIEGPQTALVEDGFGLLLTEPGLLGVPELMVAFAYDQPWDPEAVFLIQVRRAEVADETSDMT